MKLPKHLVDGIILSALAFTAIRAVLIRIPRDAKVSTADWIAMAGTATGQATAPRERVLVEFIDYQCPFCARVENEVMTAKLLDSLHVRRVIRHFPLPYHAQAFTAAAASECVTRQTSASSDVHELLLKQQDSLGKVPWTGIALAAGVRDTIAFNRCLTDPLIAQHVQQDLALGKRVGVSGTPVFYLDGVKVPSMQPAQLAAYLGSPKRSVGLADIGNAIASFF